MGYGNMRKDIKHPIGFYDYTVILTYVGLFLAVWGIFTAIDGKAGKSVFLLMWAGLCDMFDGAVASTKKRNENEKFFGIQIDSLADLVSFGVLPAVIAYTQSPIKQISCVIAALYILAALIRLAYFNLLEENRQKSPSSAEKRYLGIPVTTIAVIMPVITVLYTMGIIANPTAFTIALIPMGCGFLTPIEIKKPNIVGKVILLLLAVVEAVALFLSRSVM